MNLSSVTSLLSVANPQAFLAKIGLYALVAFTFIGIGAYGGYKYAKNSCEAAKVEGMVQAQKQERKDTKAGEQTAKEFEADKRQIETARDFINKDSHDSTSKAPLAKILLRKASQEVGQKTESNNSIHDKTSGVTTPASSDVQSDTKVVGDEKIYPVIVLTDHFKQLYDVSIQPGNVELRAGTYATTEDTSLDEGFEKVIGPNNLDCASNTAQLIRLQERILEKQKIFGQSP